MKPLIGLILILLGNVVNAQATAIGIELLSETHHLLGSAASFYPTPNDFHYGSYDIVRKESFSYEIYGESGWTDYNELIFGYSRASAGDFSLSAGASPWESRAEAESVYRFRPESSSFNFDIYGRVEIYERYESIVQFSLTDISTNRILFDERLGLPFASPNINDWRVNNVDLSYNFFLNSTHEYDLILYALASGGDDTRWTTLRADIYPVPEPASMLLFGTGLLGLTGFRIRKKKK